MADYDSDSSDDLRSSDSDEENFADLGDQPPPPAEAAREPDSVPMATVAADNDAEAAGSQSSRSSVAEASSSSSDDDADGNPFEEIRDSLDRLAGDSEEKEFVNDLMSNETVAILCDLVEYLNSELKTFCLSAEFKEQIASLPELLASVLLAHESCQQPEQKAQLDELGGLLASTFATSMFRCVMEVARAEFEPVLGELPDDYEISSSSASSTLDRSATQQQQQQQHQHQHQQQHQQHQPRQNGEADSLGRQRSGKQVSYVGLPPEQPPPAGAAAGNSGGVALRNASGRGNPAYRDSNLVEHRVTAYKAEGEPLGFTATRQFVEQFGKDLIAVERILHDGPLHRQGVLQVGDIVTEINEQPLESPEALQRMLRQASGDILFTVLTPAFRSARTEHNTLYLRACFEYRPEYDSLLPAKDLGMRFACGDILQVVNQEDPNFWQARLVGRQSGTKLIPSQQLEEKRKAFIPVSQEAQTRKSGLAACSPFGLRKGKAKKALFSTEAAAEFDRAEIWTYEEVLMCPAEPASCLVLVGPPGIGRRTIKKWLCSRNSDKFGTPRTTRSGQQQQQGDDSQLAPKEEMRRAILAGEFLEYGEHQGELLGLQLDSIREVMQSGRTAVVDCLCTSLKRLRSSEFRPYVVFMAAPAVEVQQQLQERGRSQGLLRRERSPEEMQLAVAKSIRLERLYRPLFDLAVLCDNLESVYQRIVSAVEAVESEGRWLPASWVSDFDDVSA